jgi:SAM-dependent methyltransferase
MNFPVSVPIELPDGSYVEDFVDYEDWKFQPAYKSVKGREKKPIAMSLFLAEQHHLYYGRPWFLGRYCFDYLVKAGLKPHHRFLDLGCGAGRVGTWLIRYLDAGNYFGIDSHLPSLAAFSGYELPLHDLANKQPRLMWSKDFDAVAFGVKFDVLLELSVTQRWTAMAAYEKIAPSLAPGAMCFQLHEEQKCMPEDMEKIGFKFARRDVVQYPLFRQLEPPIQFEDQWDLFVHAPNQSRMKAL